MCVRVCVFEWGAHMQGCRRLQMSSPWAIWQQLLCPHRHPTDEDSKWAGECVFLCAFFFCLFLAVSRRHNWQAASLISAQLLWSLHTASPLFPNTSIMLAKVWEAYGHGAVALPDSTSAQTSPGLCRGEQGGGWAACSADAGRPTLRIHSFYKGKELCTAWLATVGVGFGVHCSLFDVFEGFLLILADGFDLRKTKYSQIP